MARVLPYSPATFSPVVDPKPSSQRALLGDVLVHAGVLGRDDLAAALDQQRQQDQRLGRILLANRVVSREDIAAALSQQSGIGRVDLAESPPDAALVRSVDPYRCLELGAVPWRQFGGTRVIAISNPDMASAAMEACGGTAEKLAFALADPEAVRRSITQICAGRLRDDARERCPEQFSCRTWTRLPRRRPLYVAVPLLLGGVALAPVLALQVLMAWILFANAVTMALRLFAIFARHQVRRAPVVHDAPRLADYKKLPRVSILVPLRREEAVAERLVRELQKLDYPPALLDIKLVIDEDDPVMVAALDRIALPDTMDVVTVPADGLQTKPRAMNYALPFCEGEIVGVYDAEDRPEPDQIRKVVAHLQSAPPDVACVQGHLDFYNTDRNWLSRCFTIEYAVWFRVILHGVQRLGFPIPLGGTTVFFRRNLLESIGAWDAHNVTEDADLGMRLARFGYRCEMISSTTWEEANARLWPWIGQRSRWLKGYAITWATHMMRPRALYADLGLRGFIGFQVLFLGAITSYLSLPLFWVILTASLGLDLRFWQTFPGWLTTGFFGSMMAGQAIMFVVAWIAARDLRRPRLRRWVLVLPFYWPLGAFAAYLALGEIFSRPSHWHKTEHGVGEASAIQ